MDGFRLRPAGLLWIVAQRVRRRAWPRGWRAGVAAWAALLLWLTPALGTAQGGGAAQASAARTQAAEQVLLQMRSAAQAGDAARLATLLPLVQGHPLEPLAAYWTLRARLSLASDDEVQAFLTRWAGTYWEDRLRTDWILWLGQQRRWATIVAAAEALRMNDDAEVRCVVALARLEQGLSSAAEIAPTVQQAWWSQRNASPGCAAAAGRLIQAGALPADLAWRRARLGIEAGRLAVATQAVGLVAPEMVALVERAYQDPQAVLDEKRTALRQRSKELVTLALIRLASQDPPAAAQHVERWRWRVQLTPEERAWIWGAIGKRAALRLSPEAPSYFAHADDALLPDEWRVWKIRAALRAGDWPQVRRSIEHLSEAWQADPAWVYWRARALLASGRAEETALAHNLLARIASAEGFYEQLASEALGRPVTLPPAPLPPSASERAAVRSNPGLQRALLAIELGLRTEGVREWHYEVALRQPGGLDDRLLLAAAEWACERGVWDRCINTSARTRMLVDIAQRYPLPLRELVVRRARDVGLDPAYVYGLVRQESRFVTDARSSVGAAGLMQVMPATARWTARKIGLQGFAVEHLHDPDINVQIGTAYLKLALDDFEGSMALAAAAYNAGPARARQWRQGPELDGAVWIENIPFDETRDYVKRVLANTTVYAAILSGEPQRLVSRVGRIGPRLNTARAPDTDLP
jgi:soluble lytic murein transglycosylase